MVVTRALVTRLKSFKMFLGFDWLQAVNLQISWQEMMIGTLEGQEMMVMRAIQKGPGLTPDYVKMFPEVFLEEGFEDLPPRQPWDHMINIVEGSTPPRGKCYPMSRHKWEELKRFIETNQKAGKI
jgi:hypothetical protein